MTVIDAPTSEMSADERRVAELVDDLLASFPPATTDPKVFLGEQFDRGLAWVQFPEGHGGLGLTPKLQKQINERVYAAGAPNPMYRNPIGHGMTGPTVAVWGSEEQKSRYLRPLFTGEEIWCQLFSEPGSGSDFAGLSSTGVKDGDEWIVNGQKVWTTLAHLSRWGLLVVRTDPQAVKHAGLTAFVVDMQAPTVEIRPLRQMTGEAEFNEVFFSRHPHPRRGDARQPRRRLARVAHDVDERARVDRRHDPDQGLGHDLRAHRRLEVAAGGPQGPGPARRGDEALGPRRGAAAHEHPRQPEPQDGRPRPRGFDRQDGLGRPEQGHLRRWSST